VTDLPARLAARHAPPAAFEEPRDIARAAIEATRLDRARILTAFGLSSDADRSFHDTFRDADLHVLELGLQDGTPERELWGRMLYAALSAAAAAVHAADDEERWRGALGDQYDDVRRRLGRRTVNGRRLEGAIPLGRLTPGLVAWVLDGGELGVAVAGAGGV
jgi:hypothetical protein